MSPDLMTGAQFGSRRTIDGVSPARVQAPASIVELQELLRASSELGVVVSGHGTKLDFGATPTRYDLGIDLTCLPEHIDHSPGDLVVRVSANTPMRELNTVLAGAGQRLSIDEVVADSTVGGVVATSLSGPLRYRFGAVRDLLIGVQFIRADGTAAKAGGIVAKNVAGYDLSKLLCGSFGTLAVLTECVFRLHPLPERQRVLTATLPIDDAATAARAIAGGVLDATAIEMNLQPDRMAELAVLIEGSSTGSLRRTGDLARLIGPNTTEAEGLPTWWGKLPGEVVLKVTFASAHAIEVVSRVLACLGDDALIRGSIALGMVHIGLAKEMPNDELSSVLATLRTALLPYEGAVQVLRAKGEQKVGVDLFGPVPGLDLMRRIKLQFDPQLTLGPGRFVGGW